jgi:hypothetical protein
MRAAIERRSASERQGMGAHLLQGGAVSAGSANPFAIFSVSTASSPCVAKWITR